MILELIIIAIPSMAVGAAIMKQALKSKKVQLLVDRSENKKYATMNDPELLLKKLNENGVMVDDGDEVTFTLEEKDGKKELVQKIKKNVVASGVPKIKAIKPAPKATRGKKGTLKAPKGKKGGEKK